MSTWPNVALQDVADIERDIIEASAIEDGTLYVGLENIQSGGEFIGVRTVDTGELASSKFAFSPQHLLYGKLRPYLAKVARPKFGGICSTDILPVLPGPRLDRNYLAHFLLTPDMVALASSRATGANLPRLSPRALAELRMPLPPLPAQRRIAEVLDRAEALRAMRRIALAKLDTLTQAIFLDMFGDPATNPKGWPRVRLPDAYWYQEGPGVRTCQFKAEGIKLLNVGNIEKDGSLNLGKTNRYLAEEEAFGKYRHFLVDAGDLVIASSGISFDDDGLLRTRGAFVSEAELPLCMNTSTIRFKAMSGVTDLRFLWVWLNSREFRSQITRVVTGTAQQNFGPSHLSSLLITLPPLALQRTFARRVADVDSLKTFHRASLAKLDSLFASLQHRAFRGEL